MLFSRKDFVGISSRIKSLRSILLLELPVKCVQIEQGSIHAIDELSGGFLLLDLLDFLLGLLGFQLVFHQLALIIET